MRLRSPLFAPGDSERKMTKAIASAADAVILDLEDSVAAPAKTDGARHGARRGARASRPRADRAGQSARHAVVFGRSRRGLCRHDRRRSCCRSAADPRTSLALDHHLEALEAAAGAPVGSIGVVAIVTETAGSVFNLGELRRRRVPAARDLLRRRGPLGRSRHLPPSAGRILSGARRAGARPDAGGGRRPRRSGDRHALSGPQRPRPGCGVRRMPPRRMASPARS